MITSVDTNVLFDVFRTSSPHHSQSFDWLRGAYDRGAVIVCEVVYAELVPAFMDRLSLDRALQEINAVLSPIDASIAYEMMTNLTEDHREAVAAFVEKRPPRFTGA